MSLVSLIAESMLIPKLMITRISVSTLTNLRKITFFLSFGSGNFMPTNLFMNYFFGLDFGLELICDKAKGLQSGVPNPSFVDSSRQLRYHRLILKIGYLFIYLHKAGRQSFLQDKVVVSHLLSAFRFKVCRFLGQ